MTPHSSSTPARTAASARRRNLWRLALLAAIALGVFMLCASVLVAASHRADPATNASAPAFTVQGERTMQGAKLALRGTGWPASVTVTLTGSAPPGAQKSLDLGTARVNDAGEFRASKLSDCTISSPPDPKARVTITAQSGNTNVEQRIDAAHWQCMSGDSGGS